MDHQNGNQPYTPYAPPTADIEFVRSTGETYFVPNGRSVPVLWISDAWMLFKRQPVTWIGFILFFVSMHILATYIPYDLGAIAMWIVQVLLVAGVIYSCDLLWREGSFSFSDLFIAFQRKTGPLLLSFLVAFLLLFVAVFIGVALIYSAILTIGKSDASLEIVAMLVRMGSINIWPIIIGCLILFVSFAVFGMMVWFAPALIMLHDIAPLQALKMSFFACLKNFLGGIVFFNTMLFLTFISMIPLGLGLLITMPMFFICYYTSYRSIFLHNKEN